jgi:tetratricopeptide (TPR) repeat protein
MGEYRNPGISGAPTQFNRNAPARYMPPYMGSTAAPAPYMGRTLEPPAPEPRESIWAQPFPRWLTIAAPMGMLIFLLLAGVAEISLLGGDWATGVIAASLAAFALAAITLIILGIRVGAGRRAFSTVALALLLAVALVGSALAGFSQLNTIHLAQAQHDEAAQQWRSAAQEYADGGEHGPNAPDMARVYTEWGEALAKSGDNAAAIAKLETALETYPKSGAIITRTRADLFTTYMAWLQTGATDLPYGEMVSFFTGYTNDPACDVSCQTAISGVMAQTYYQYGVQLASAADYKLAVTEFETVQSQYPTSPYAAQAHTAAATAYLTYANLVVKQDCGVAAPLYTTLAKHYADTPEGKQAKTIVATPVSVTGQVRGAPSSPPVAMYLASRPNAKSQLDLGKYHTKLDASGNYSFSSVKPGVYYPTGFQSSSTQFIYTPWTVTDAQGHNGYYSVTIGPVCSYQIPTLQW